MTQPVQLCDSCKSNIETATIEEGSNCTNIAMCKTCSNAHLDKYAEEAKNNGDMKMCNYYLDAKNYLRVNIIKEK